MQTALVSEVCWEGEVLKLILSERKVGERNIHHAYKIKQSQITFVHSLILWPIASGHRNISTYHQVVLLPIMYCTNDYWNILLVFICMGFSMFFYGKVVNRV